MPRHSKSLPPEILELLGQAKEALAVHTMGMTDDVSTVKMRKGIEDSGFDEPKNKWMVEGDREQLEQLVSDLSYLVGVRRQSSQRPNLDKLQRQLEHRLSPSASEGERAQLETLIAEVYDSTSERLAQVVCCDPLEPASVLDAVHDCLKSGIPSDPNVRKLATMADLMRERLEDLHNEVEHLNGHLKAIKLASFVDRLTGRKVVQGSSEKLKEILMQMDVQISERMQQDTGVDFLNDNERMKWSDWLNKAREVIHQVRIYMQNPNSIGDDENFEEVIVSFEAKVKGLSWLLGVG